MMAIAYLRQLRCLMVAALALAACGAAAPAQPSAGMASLPPSRAAASVSAMGVGVSPAASSMAMDGSAAASTGMAMDASASAGGMDMGASASAGGMDMGGGMPSGPPLPTLTPGVAAEIPAAQPDLAAFPVTIENCGRTLTFDRPPERAVPLYPLTAEFLLRLGLQDRIVGVAFSQAAPVAPDLRTAFNALPVLTTDAPPNRELLLTAQPDFVIDNFPGQFYNAAQGLATIEELAANGAPAYTLTSRCDGAEATGTVADIYTDIGNLGTIFGVADQAEQLIASLKDRVATVQDTIAGQPRLPILVYDSGIGPINVFGPGAIADVAALAGGENVFPDGNREFLMLSAEEVAARDPAVFVVFDRQGVRQMSMGKDLSAQEAAQFLIETFPNTSAAKNRRIAVVPFEQVYAGLQSIDGVEALAKQFYPETFE